MDEIIVKTLALKKELNEKPEVKLFLECKKEFETNKELVNLRREIASSNGEEKEKLTRKYTQHPIVINYNESKKEVFEIISVISDIIK